MFLTLFKLKKLMETIWFHAVETKEYFNNLGYKYS